MPRLLVSTRFAARALGLGCAGLAALPILPTTAQARPLAHVAIVAPAGHAVSGSIPFAARVAGRSIRKVVFSVDHNRGWTTSRSPFRYHRNGRLNTRTLRNGPHVLVIKAYSAHGVVGTSSKRIIVQNRTLTKSVKAPGSPAVSPPRKKKPPVRPKPPVPPTPPVTTTPSTGFVAPPVGGVAGPSPVVFNRESYKFSTTLTTAQEASRYQVMVLQASDGPEVATLHAANPNLIILLYQHPWVSRISDPGALSVCTSYANDLANHPSWFLKDQHGNLVGSGSFSDTLMDIGNPAYQQACAANAVALAKHYGFNGVFFDGLASTLQWELPSGTSVPEYPTLASWQAAMSSWVSYAATALHAQGLKVFGNICGSTLTPGLWQKWAAPLDGAEEESWTDGGAGTAQQISDWPTKLADAAWSAANGKTEILHSYNNTEAGNTYGLASMLLVAGGDTSYSTSNANYTSAEAFYPEYTTAQSLGAPAGPYVKLANGVYERPFANGIVLVNPTATAVPAFSLGGGIYSGSQVTNVSSVSMGATSGLILQKVG
jgi:hypothetical protein